MPADVTPFLATPQFETMFRPLSSPERALAELTLRAAAILIRRRVAAAGRTIEDNDPMAILVSFEVTRDALPRLPDLEGRISYSITADDRTEQGTLAQAAGILEFEDRHWTLLGLSPTAGPHYGGMDGDFGSLGVANPSPIVVGERVDRWV